MTINRIENQSRNGTVGINMETDVEANNCVWIAPPDRVTSVSVSVHIPEGESAKFRIQATCNTLAVIGEDGTGGYWDDVDEKGTVYERDTNICLANVVTGVRVICDAASSFINVAFVG